MTPQEHELAHQILLQAVELPHDQRQSFLEQAALSEVVRREVLSLLQYHDQQTLLPEVNQPPLDRNDSSVTDTLLPNQTIANLNELPQESLVHDPDLTPRDRLSLPSSDENVEAHFERCTNLLLRRRLIVVATLFAILSPLGTMVGVLTGNFHSTELLLRGISMVLLGSLAYLLHRTREPRLSLLRCIDVLVLLTPVISVCYTEWFMLNQYIKTDSLPEIEALRVLTVLVASMLVVIYNGFIPSTWIQTAINSAVVLFVPMTVLGVHRRIHGYDHGDGFIFYSALTCSLIVIGMTAVFSRIVHNVRRDVETAKYYGQYRLIREIGRGAMGIVYLAKHQFLKRPAAIKLILGDVAGSRKAIKHFEKEVQASAALSHWNTVQIYDYGITEEGDLYYVMEYLHGETLNQRLSAQADRRIGTHKLLEIVIQLCNGLQEAHSQGLVHRDVKPANIFLAEIGGQSDVVKLLDFGLVTDTKSSSDPKNNVGGTPSYMSPEQIRGETLDGRSDIYAFGCVMYHCLTSKPLFYSASISQTLSDQLFEQPDLSPLKHQPVELQRIVKTALDKTPEKRFQTVTELRDSCLRLLQELPPDDATAVSSSI